MLCCDTLRKHFVSWFFLYTDTVLNMLTLPCYLMTLICDDSSSRSKVKLFDSTCNFFFKYSNLLYTNIYTYFYTWPAECTWDTDGGERTVPKSSGHCLPHPRKASLCHWKITLRSVPKDVSTTLFTCITLYPYTTGKVKREWPLLELNIFKFHPTFSSYVYAIR